MAWRIALPYTVTFDMRTCVAPKTLIERRAAGELDGVGRWILSADSGRTKVRYQWSVDVTKRSMRILAPTLRPVFAWNHGVVMRWGCEGLRHKLANERLV
jgi:hypothetical protein